MESILFAVDGRIDVAKNIIKEGKDTFSRDFNTKLGKLNIQKFSDNESCPDFEDSVRGKRVYLLSSPNTPEEIIRLFLAIDAAKRAEAKEIIPILPYFPYARQDKKDQPRGPIGAKMIATNLEALGATSIITFDLHADQIQGFFEIPVTHIEGKNVFDSYIASICDENTILCGPDAGASKRVKRMKDRLQNAHNLSLTFVMIDKTRSKANQIDEMIIIGDVKGKDVIIIDDMVDTAGTLCKAASELKKNGAKSVRAVAAHGVLSGRAYINIGQSQLDEVVISNSLPRKSVEELCLVDYTEEDCYNIHKAYDKIKVVEVNRQIAMVIMAKETDTSYEQLKK
jgi:ribose-phosphate pyrophosphokinase